MNNNTKEKTPVKSPKKRIAIVIGLLFLSWVGYWGVMFFYPIYYGVYGERHQKAKDFGHPERPVEVTVKGKAFGYDVNLDDVLICQGEYNPKFEVSGEYWWLKHPYMYQMNDDGSVLVLSLSGTMVCDEGWRKSLEKTNAIVNSVFWYSNRDKPKNIKKIVRDKGLQIFNVNVFEDPKNKIQQQDYEFLWDNSDCSQSNIQSKTSYSYFIDSVRVIKEDEWRQIDFLKQNINKKAELPYQIYVPIEQVRNINKFRYKNYGVNKESEQVYEIDITNKLEGISEYTFDKEVDLPFQDCKKYNPEFSQDAVFYIGEEKLSFSDIDVSKATKMTKGDSGRFFFYFPKNKVVVQFHDLKPNSILYPAIPVIEEIK